MQENLAALQEEMQEELTIQQFDSDEPGIMVGPVATVRLC